MKAAYVAWIAFLTRQSEFRHRLQHLAQFTVMLVRDCPRPRGCILSFSVDAILESPLQDFHAKHFVKRIIAIWNVSSRLREQREITMDILH